MELPYRTRRHRELTLHDDDVGLHSRIDRAGTEAALDRLFGGVDGLVETRPIARLDFVAQRRPLAERHGRYASGRGAAACGDCFDFRSHEPGGGEMPDNRRLVVV